MMVINLFGVGLKYAVFDLPETIYEKMNQLSLKTNQSLTQIVGDLEFWELYGMNQVFDLPIISKGFGLVENESSIFEWKNNRKLIRKINLHQLSNDGLLFPIYNIEYKNENLILKSDEKQIKLILLEFSKGPVAKYSINQEINLEDLNFVFKSIEIENESFSFLSGVKYKDQILTSKSDHSLVTHQRVFIF